MQATPKDDTKRPHAKTLFSSIMAPLREKIGETITKFSDRLHKRRASEDGESSQWSKVPKRTPSPPPGSSSAPAMSFLGLKPPGASAPLHPPKPSELLLLVPGTSSSSSSSSYVSCQPGSSPTNPIDLSNTSPDGRHSPAPSWSSLSSLSEGMAGSDGATLANRDKLKRRADKRHDAPMESFGEPTSENSAAPEPSLFEDASLSTFGQYLAELRCNNPKCEEPMPLTREQLGARMKSGFDSKGGQGLLHSYLRCARCRTFSCAGIHCTRHKATLDLRQITSVSVCAGQKIAWCCDAGRQFLILAVACGPAPATVDSKTRSDAKSAKGAAKSLLQATGKKIHKPKGNAAAHAAAAHAAALAHGHGSKLSHLSQGTGYGGTNSPSGMLHVWEHATSSVAKITAPLKKPVISKADRELEMYFLALSKLLPFQPLGEATPSFDHRSHARTAEILAKSPLLPRASEIMRRSSVEDMGTQHRLYHSLLQFLTAISRHTDLRSILFHRQTLYPESQQVAAVVFASGDGMLRPLVACDTTQSLDELLQQLAKICRHFVENAQRYSGELQDTDDVRPLSVAKAVLATVEELHFSRTMAASVSSKDGASSKSPGTGPLPNVLTRSRAAKMATTDGDDHGGKRMAAWHLEHCVEAVPDETIMDGFAFAADADALQGQASGKGRMKSLVVQLASLSTGLPQGIYVRHGSSRLDVIRVLILGPKGTPYENGVFEFDMFCDSAFPSRAPNMMFRTTGGGTVHFNPNLYVNGKVCLSLLGTWSGHSWEPHRSTILQVLVSIQGMIFNSTPWYNEPGREYKLDDENSSEYSRRIWGYTLRYATLYWLKSRLCAPGSSKGKNRAGNAPQSSRATSLAAATGEPVTQAPANPTMASNAEHLWSEYLPDALLAWESDASDGIAGPSFQHTVASSSKSAPPSLMTHALEEEALAHSMEAKVKHQEALYKQHSMEAKVKHQEALYEQAKQKLQLENAYAKQYSDAIKKHAALTQQQQMPLTHPHQMPLTHPHQIPAGMPPFHPGLMDPSMSGHSLLSYYAPYFMSGKSAHMQYAAPDEVQHYKNQHQLYQSQWQMLAMKHSAAPPNPNNLDFFHQLPPQPPPLQPTTSSVDPEHDDALWGPTLREYFSAMATTIVNTAATSPYQTDRAVLKQLKEALAMHGFL